MHALRMCSSLCREHDLTRKPGSSGHMVFGSFLAVRKSSVDEIKAGAKAPLGTRCAGADGVVRIDAGHWGIPAAT